MAASASAMRFSSSSAPTGAASCSISGASSSSSSDSSSSAKRRANGSMAKAAANGHTPGSGQEHKQIGALPDVDELPGGIAAKKKRRKKGKAAAKRSPGRSTGQQKTRQERTSDAIMQMTTLPVAGVLLYNLIFPDPTTQLAVRDTRQPAYHIISSFLHKCVHLSYREPSFSSLPSKVLGATSRVSSGPTYLKGIDDLYFMLYFVLVFALLREVLMRFVFTPLGRTLGVSSRKDILRFAEQGYNLVYYSLGWAAGFYVMQHSEYRNIALEGLWKGYPHYQMPRNLKAYYLIQAAFWISQIMVINIEKRRKDYYQMFTHHVITCALMTLSYLWNFTRVGNVILVLMDPCDFVLAMAKMAKYLHLERSCDIMFVVFMLTWIGTRLVLYPRVLLSVIRDTTKYIKYAWNPAKEIYFTRNAHLVFILLLVALQILLLLWFVMIVKVAWAVISGKGAEDSRSDDEDDGGEDVIMEEAEKSDTGLTSETATTSMDDTETEHTAQLSHTMTRVDGVNGVHAMPKDNRRANGTDAAPTQNGKKGATKSKKRTR